VLIAAAVCPHPPLLVPELASGAAPELDDLRAACDAAIAAMAAAEPDLIVVVGGAARDAELDSSAAGSLAGYGVAWKTGEGEPVLPLSLTIGRWLLERGGLLDRAGRLEQGRRPGPPRGEQPAARPSAPPAARPSAPTAARPLAPATARPLAPPAARPSAPPAARPLAPPAPGRPAPPCEQPGVRLRATAFHSPAQTCLRLGAEIAARARRVAVLTMGDGTARLSTRAPGYFDARAEPYNTAVASALASADAGWLAQLDPGLSDELMAAGRAAWQVLAGAAGGGRYRAHLHYAAAPYGVGYFVASWRALTQP